MQQQQRSNGGLLGGRAAAAALCLWGLVCGTLSMWPGLPVALVCPWPVSGGLVLSGLVLLLLSRTAPGHGWAATRAAALLLVLGAVGIWVWQGLGSGAHGGAYIYAPVDASAFLAIGGAALVWRRSVHIPQWLTLWVFCVAFLHLAGFLVGLEFQHLQLKLPLRSAPILAIAFALACLAMAALGWTMGGWDVAFQGRDDRRVMVQITLVTLLGFSVLLLTVLISSLHLVLGQIPQTLTPAQQIPVRDALWNSVRDHAVTTALGMLLLVGLLLALVRAAIRPLVQSGMQGREYLKWVLEQAPSAMIVTDHDGRVHEFNHEAVRLFGRSAQDVVGQSMELLFPAEFVATHLRDQSPGVRQGLHAVIEPADGRRRPVELDMTWMALWGRPVCILLVRDYAEGEQHAIMEKRWQEAFMSAAWGIALSDSASQTFLDVNLAYAVMHGYSREELIGTAIADLFTDEERLRLPGHVARAREGGYYSFESVHRRRDGSVFPVRIELSCKYDLEQGSELFIGNVQDISAELQMSHRLRDVEQVSRLVLNVQTEMVVRWRPDTTIVFANRAYAEIFGRDLDSLAGLRWLDLEGAAGASPVELARHQAMLDDLNSNPRRLEQVVKVQHASRGAIWVQWSVLPLFDARQQLEGFQVTGRDITARKQAEDALARSERWFRGVFDAMFHHLAIVDQQGKLCALNQNAATFLGRPAPLLIGMPLWEIDAFQPHTANAEKMRQAIRAVASGQQSVRLELQMPNVLGVPHMFDVSVRPMEGDGRSIEHLVVEAQDISEVKRRERQQKEREEHFQSITESMPGMVFQFVREAERLRILYINRGGVQLCQSVASAEGNAADHSMLECIHPDCRIEFFRGIKAAEKSASAFHWMGRINHAWEEVWVSLHAEQHLGPQGIVWSGVAIDISSLKQHEQALETSQGALRELAARHEQVREDERRHLAREVHDELGQNLTALRMGLSVLGQKANPDDLEQEVCRLKTVVDSSIATVRGIVSSLRPPAMDLGISQALQWVASEFQSHSRIACELSLEVDDIALQDETATALFRIVQESLTNIAKHAKATEVNILLRRMGRFLVVEVSDNGVGFDVHARQGGGFGLMGMRERVISLSGTLVINSAPGQGSVISIQIPMDLKESQA